MTGIQRNRHRIAATATWLALATGLASAPAAGADQPAGTAAKSTPTDPAARAEAVRTEIDQLDAEVQRGLTLLTDALADANTERKAWAGLDRSVAAARVVNKALGERCRAVIKIYDSHAATSLAKFEKKLKDAPPVFRALAEVRKAQLAAATLDYERRNYSAMAELCEAAAVLCERRHEELFGADPGSKAAPGQPRRANAATLATTVANMRKLVAVHDRWEETFAAYPSALDEGKLATLFEHISAYAEDLEAFTTGVESLKETLKQKATPSDKAPAGSGEKSPPKDKPGAVLSPAPAPLPTGQVSTLATTAGRKLSQPELQARVDAAVRGLLAAPPTGGRVGIVQSVRVASLPAQLDPNRVYVVSGVAPGGTVPPNVVYDSVATGPEGRR